MPRFNVRLAVATVLTLAIPAIARMTSAASEADAVAEAQKTIAVFRKADPGIDAFFERSAGYVVFPSIVKGGLGIGGAHGTGVAFERSKPVGKASLSQVSVGAQIGGQEFSEVIFFETPRALHQFMAGETTLSAQASAVALKSGASANAKYKDGVAIFTATKGGLMAEASVGGQKISFQPFPTSH